jgi:DNA primase catalytic subunit
MIIPETAIYYIERRSDVCIVFQKNSLGAYVRVQKFTDFADAKKYVKDSAKDTFYFYDADGARIKEDGTPAPEV